MVAFPDKQTLENQAQLRVWTDEEVARERRVRHTLGFYYRPHLRLSLQAFMVSIGDVALRTVRRMRETFAQSKSVPPT